MATTAPPSPNSKASGNANISEPARASSTMGGDLPDAQAALRAQLHLELGAGRGLHLGGVRRVRPVGAQSRGLGGQPEGVGPGQGPDGSVGLD
ncbi:hypothetical protein GCM10020254_25750 [Streptomyces goshikiensis]